MRKDLIYTYNKDWKFDQWNTWRFQNGIGASEAGAVAGVDRFLPTQKLFYQKIGIVREKKLVSYQAFTGRLQEDLVALQFEHFEKDFIQMMENFENDVKVAKVERVNAFIQNPDFMHLFASLDRKILNVLKYEGKGNAPLECKTMDWFVGNQYENGFPISYIFQVNQQIGIVGSDYGCLAVQTNNRDFDVYEFEFQQELFDGYLELSQDFWNKVLKGRELALKKFEADIEYNVRLSEEIMHEIQMLEPAVQGSLSYQDFLKDKYRNATKGSSRKATPQEVEQVREMMQLKKEKETIEEKFLLQENSIKNAMGGVEELIVDKLGRITWKNDTRGHRRFNTRIKL